MSEINNNIHNYGYKIDRIDTKKNAPKQDNEAPKEAAEQQYVPDTGILGLSQMYSPNGGNIAKSVDEAVEMAQSEPIRMGCSGSLFDTMYQQYINSGLNEADAYMKALLDEEEFLKMSTAYNR